MKPTDVSKFIGELGAGVTEEKLAHILTDVAVAVMQYSKQGEVTLKLKLKPAGTSAEQVAVEHTLSYSKPKKRGDIKETDVQETVMYQNTGGNPSLFPEHQTDMFRNQETEHAD